MTENRHLPVHHFCLKKFEALRSTAVRAVVSSVALVVLLMVTAPFLAPEAHAQGIMLRGGLNLANATIDPEPASPGGADMRKGLNAALLGELGGGPVRLMVGAGYESRGVELTGPGGGDVILEYVTVPVMIGMGPPSMSANACVFVNVGVEPAFLIASKLPAGNGAPSEEDIRDFDFNGRVEIGIELPVSYSGPSLMLGGAYTLGLTDIDRSSDSWRNHAFHIFAGLKLRSL